MLPVATLGEWFGQSVPPLLVFTRSILLLLLPHRATLVVGCVIIPRVVAIGQGHWYALNWHYSLSRRDSSATRKHPFLVCFFRPNDA